MLKNFLKNNKPVCQALCQALEVTGETQERYTDEAYVLMGVPNTKQMDEEEMVMVWGV